MDLEKGSKGIDPSILETRDVYRNYEKCLEAIKTSHKEEETKDLLFFPNDNVVVEEKFHKRDENEKIEPDLEDGEKLPLFSQMCTKFYKSPKVFVKHNYKTYRKIETMKLSFPKYKYYADIASSNKKKEKKEKKSTVKRKMDFCTPNHKKARSRIKKSLVPMFHVLYDHLKSEETFSWSGGMEYQVCKRKTTAKERVDLNKVSFLVDIENFETRFQEKFGDVEPLFLEMALYDMKKYKKLSEEFYFDFNSESILSLITRGCKYINNNFKNKAIFSVNYRSQNIVMVVIINKVLEGNEDNVIDRYVRPEKFKESDLKKLKKNAHIFCSKLGFLRQPLAYALLPVFDENEDLVLGQEEELIFLKTPGNVSMDSMFKKEDKGKNSSKSSTSKKMKTISAMLHLEVNELSEFKLEHLENGFVRINNKAEIKKIESFCEPKNEFNHKYKHYLYIYPRSVRFGSSKNITIRIQVKDNDSLLNDKEPLSAIFGRSCQDILIRTQYSKVTYHKKHPKFNDEFKIKLPGVIKKNHHILFSFYHANTKLKSSKPTLQPLGHCFIRLIDDDGKIISGKQILDVITDFENGNNYFSDKPKRILEGIFKVNFVSESTIYPKETFLAKFFKEPEKNVLNITEAFKRDRKGVITNLPEIFNYLFEVLCKSYENAVLSNTFMGMINLVHSISIESEDDSRSSLLWDYVENYFMNPSGDGVSSPFFQITHLWLSLIKDGQTKRKFEKTSSKNRAPASSPTKTSILSDQKEKFFNKSLNYSWFFFEIIYKSVLLSLSLDQKKFEKKPKKRLCDKQFTKILTKLIVCISGEVTHRIEELSLAKSLNCMVALFLRDLFNVMDRGDVLILIDTYLHHTNSVRKSVTQEITITFCKIIADGEHYIPLSLPRSYEMTGINTEKKLMDLSFLCGIITRQCIKDICDKERTIRERCFDLIKYLLMKHEYDSRYQSQNKKKNIALLYFPYTLLFLDKLQDYEKICEIDYKKNTAIVKTTQASLRSRDAHLSQTKISYENLKDETAKEKVKGIIEKLQSEVNKLKKDLQQSELALEEEEYRTKQEKKHAYLSLISVLFHMDRRILLEWIKKEHSDKVEKMLYFFIRALELFEYRGRKTIKNEEEKFGSFRSQSEALIDTKKLIEQRYNRFGTFRKGMGGIGGRASLTSKMRQRNSSRIGRSTLNRSLRMSLKRTTLGVGGSANPAEIKLGVEELKKKMLWEGRLSSSVGLGILSILMDLIRAFPLKSEYMDKIYDICMTFFGTKRSEKELLAFFGFLKSYIDVFRQRMFLNSTRYSEALCEVLMKKCYSKSSKVRARAAGCLYMLIKFNFLEMGNFTRTKIQTATKLSGLVTELDERSVIFLDFCFQAIKDYADEDDVSKHFVRKKKRNIQKQFSKQVSLLVNRLQTTLLDTRLISTYIDKPEEHEKLVDLFLRLGRNSRDAPELSATWYVNLAEFHYKHGRFIESAMTKLYVASLVFQVKTLQKDELFTKLDFSLIQKNSKSIQNEEYKEINFLFKEGTPTFQSQLFTREGFLRLINDCIALFNRSQYYEFEMNLHKLLEQYYSIITDYVRLETIYGNLSQTCALILKEREQPNRFFGSYYLLSFFGTKWSSLNKKSFVYKFPKLYRLSDVISYLEKTYSVFGKENIYVLSSTNKIPEGSENDEVKAYALIQNLNIYKEKEKTEEMNFEEEFQKEDYFETHTFLSKFYYETPFTKVGKKSHAKSLGDQYLRKTVLITKDCFPFMKSNSLVVDKLFIEYSPIENSIQTINRALKRLRSFQNRRRTKIDIISLQMTLTGTVIPTVHEGIPNIIKTFLTEEYEKNHETEKSCSILKERLKQFLIYSLFAIQLNEKNINTSSKLQLEMHEQFILGYSKLYTMIGERIGFLGSLGLQFLKYLYPTFKEKSKKISSGTFQGFFEICFSEFKERKKKANEALQKQL